MTGVAVTVVVEWENVELAGALQATQMLARLTEEVAAQSVSVEVLICIAGEGTEPGDTWLPPLPQGWQILTVGDAHYYDIKNRGAAVARGAVVVFLDSDAVPATGWLAALLEPFADPDVRVVAGHTIIQPTSFVARSFALWWFFPLLEERPAPAAPTNWFFANNVAFRRDVLREHPFVSPEGTARGACIQLASRLLKAGIGIISAPDAVAAHPPPNGWRHMALRSVVQGRDRVLRDRDHRSFTDSWVTFARHIARSWWRSITRGSAVGLTPIQRPISAMLGSVYYTGYLSGEVAAHLGIARVARLRV